MSYKHLQYPVAVILAPELRMHGEFMIWRSNKDDIYQAGLFPAMTFLSARSISKNFELYRQLESVPTCQPTHNCDLGRGQWLTAELCLT